jgi:DnaJ-class molecular chaperone
MGIRLTAVSAVTAQGERSMTLGPMREAKRKLQKAEHEFDEAAAVWGALDITISVLDRYTDPNPARPKEKQQAETRLCAAAKAVARARVALADILAAPVCPECNGSGRVLDAVCSVCGGTGEVQ